MKTTTITCLISILILGVSCEKEGLIGSFRDSRDGNRYKMVRIGDQIWMAENLAYLPQVSSSATKSKTEPFYYVYDFDNQNVVGAKNNHYYQEYGALYNWEAAKISCPEGWHLPTTAEWMTLCKNVDSNPKMDAFRLKSLTGWVQNGNGDNSSGFNALPAGFLGGGFGGAGAVAYFWTITSTSINNEPRTAECWRFDYWFTNTSSSLEWRDMGFSVRCVKD